MVAEVDTGAGFGDGLDLVEQRLERLGRHQIGDERRDAAERRRGGLGRGVLRHARTRDVLAVTEMQMHVDHARQNDLSRRRRGFRAHRPPFRARGLRRCAVLDSDIRRDTVGVRQDGRAPANDQVKAHSALYLGARARSLPRPKSAECLRKLADRSCLRRRKPRPRACARRALRRLQSSVGAEFRKTASRDGRTPRSAENILDINLARVAVSECDMDARLEAVREIRVRSSRGR